VTAEGSKYFATHVVDQTLFVVPSRYVASLTGVELAKERAAFLEEMQHSSVREVIFDLWALEAFGSLMLGTLCLAWKQARDQGAAMALCNVSAIGRQVLERSKLNSLWPIHASRDIAVESLGSAGERKSALPDSDTEFFGIPQTKARSRLQVIELGPRTVIGFGGADLRPEHVLGQYLNEISELIATSRCSELSFDLTGVSAVPSGFLGLMASVLKKGVAVSVKNASKEVREVLALTNFDRLVKVL
jgi:anti-anti-sigma factor